MVMISTSSASCFPYDLRNPEIKLITNVQYENCDHQTLQQRSGTGSEDVHRGMPDSQRAFRQNKMVRFVMARKLDSWITYEVQHVLNCRARATSPGGRCGTSHPPSNRMQKRSRRCVSVHCWNVATPTSISFEGVHRASTLHCRNTKTQI